MKIEKISENKIKVTISLNDLEERNIDLNSLNYNSPATQELFWDMMEQAEVQYGFNAADSQICVEAIPDSEDGFIITITKIDEDGDFESIQKYIKNKYRNTDVRVKRKSRRLYSTIMIYSFSKFEDLCMLTENIRLLYKGDSSLYKYKNTYYLILTRNSLNTVNTKAFELMLSEYGKKVSNTSFYEGFLSEHGTQIIEYDALEIINSYFNCHA
ncbi:MAG: adaptor protein MecA [Clostridiales bacterium]|jgi:adapter protein MecA 1/2|nr:adaptor protein MecA [Eubacteriales bacterium]MDH7566408.1 adaptor protein MecA [Clostridiales bacterium]